MSSSEPSDPNRDYYDHNARDFFERTEDLGMGELYAPFVSRLAPGASILDHLSA